VDASPSELQESREIQLRLAKVRDMRISSSDKATNKDASTPFLFQKIRQPSQDYMAIPSTSSEKREYVPIALMSKDVIVNNAVLTIPESNLATFSILNSRIFNVWNSSVSGRLESRFRISAEITYNNFPFPLEIEKHREALNSNGQRIIEVRAQYGDSSLADLYDRTAMPPDLIKAHQANDKAVLAAYGLKTSVTDRDILKLLFAMYSALISEKAHLISDTPSLALDERMNSART
jgi:hypothetical protein